MQPLSYLIPHMREVRNLSLGEKPKVGVKITNYSLFPNTEAQRQGAGMAVGVTNLPSGYLPTFLLKFWLLYCIAGNVSSLQ